MTKYIQKVDDFILCKKFTLHSIIAMSITIYTNRQSINVYINDSVLMYT